MTEAREKPLLIFGSHMGLRQEDVIKILDDLGVHHRATPSSSLFHITVSNNSDLDWVDRLLERGLEVVRPTTLRLRGRKKRRS
jgi:hypothetical protein